MEQNLTSTLTQLRGEAYKNAMEKGFHDEEYPDEHWLMLIVCEIAEAVEADRNDMKMWRRSRGYEKAMKSGVKPEMAFEAYVKDTVEDEIADVVIRILDYMGLKGVRIPDGMTYLVSRLQDKEVYGRSDFAAAIYPLVRTVDGWDVLRMLATVLAFCKDREIDILKHVRLKMDYNKTRPRLHGKFY